MSSNWALVLEIAQNVCIIGLAAFLTTRVPAQAMGFPIVAFCMPLAIMMAYALFLPFNTMGNIIMFGTGYYTVIEQLKTSIILGFIMWGLWIVTAFTWWKWIGLL